jgi:putative resolvase
MKLSNWARKQGINYKTAWIWFKTGKLPVRAYQTPTGTILVEEEKPKLSGKTVIYARVSSADQKNDLQRQVERLKLFASSTGLKVSDIVTEIGSGLNGKRRKFIRLLKDAGVDTILVEHKDRAMRFGYEIVEAALRVSGRRILVADETELNNDLVQDMIDVLTSFCARLYGKRSAHNKACKALAVIQK